MEKGSLWTSREASICAKIAKGEKLGWVMNLKIITCTMSLV
jgi:hypothetical protein